MLRHGGGIFKMLSAPLGSSAGLQRQACTSIRPLVYSNVVLARPAADLGHGAQGRRVHKVGTDPSVHVDAGARSSSLVGADLGSS